MGCGTDSTNLLHIPAYTENGAALLGTIETAALLGSICSLHYVIYTNLIAERSSYIMAIIDHPYFWLGKDGFMISQDPLISSRV